MSSTTPFTVTYVESIVQGQTVYRAAWVRDGRTKEPVGPTFSSPKEAIRYAERLERRLAKEAAK